MERDWYELAARAKAAIGDVKSPGVMGRREAAAESFGLARQTLRNFISAYDFVQRLRGSDPELADLVRHMPSLAAEIYNRWWSRDPEGAAAHARLAAREGLTVRQIVAAHKAGGGPEKFEADILDELIASLPKGKFEGRIRPDIEQAFGRMYLKAPELNQLDRKRCGHPLAEAIGVDAVLVPHRGRHPLGSIGVVEVPGLALSDGIRRQWRAVLAKGLAAAHFFPLVLVLVRTREDLRELTRNIPFAPRPMGREGPWDITPEGELARALARSAAPPVLAPGERVGSVLFSSVETFVDDYHSG